MDKQQKVEFIESYIKGVNGSADYQWNDNHGELIRCKDCKHNDGARCDNLDLWVEDNPEWFCADGERK